MCLTCLHHLLSSLGGFMDSCRSMLYRCAAHVHPRIYPSSQKSLEVIQTPSGTCATHQNACFADLLGVILKTYIISYNYTRPHGTL